MTKLNHVFDGTLENFQQLVVENSRKGPVLVNYWTPNAGPCLKLWRVLEALTQEYQGRFLLVNINTDRQTLLVREQGISSVPTIKIYHKGGVVDSIYGALSETSLRNTIDKYLPPPLDGSLNQAVLLYRSGRVDEALELLRQTGAKEPTHHKLHSLTARLLLREKRYAEVESYISGLVEEVRAQHDIATLRVHARMLHLAQLAPPPEQLDEQLERKPGDLNAALSRAAVALVQDDYETALRHLMDVLQKDKHYDNGLALRAMLVIFSLLGDEHELSRTYRQTIQQALL